MVFRQVRARELTPDSVCPPLHESGYFGAFRPHKTTESAHEKPILLKPLSKVDGVANSWRRLKPDIFPDSCGQGLSKSSEVYLTSMGFVDNYLSSIYKTSFFKSDTTSVSNLMCDNRPPPSSKNAKWGKVYNLSCGNEFYSHKNEKSS